MCINTGVMEGLPLKEEQTNKSQPTKHRPHVPAK